MKKEKTVEKNESEGDKKLSEKLEWFRSSDDVRSGYIKGATFDYREVEYSVIDGLAIFEGDICIGLADKVDIVRPTLDSTNISAPGTMGGVGLPGVEYRWPNRCVPFEIDASVPNQRRTSITNAINHWEQNTHIRFIQRTSANAAQFPDFVRFISGSGCWSYVGMRGGMQELSLGAGCGSLGIAVHEIGHAIGLWHEQSREDRNNYVRINWQNIQAGRGHNFNQQITDGDDIGSYDFGSIMHYGKFAFSRNGKATIESLGGQQFGQRSGLSPGDIAAARAMYPAAGESFIGNRNTKEIHVPNCYWVTQMYGGNKVPFSTIMEAIAEGYNGCHFCLREYDTG